jgi:hypothetical protein
MDLEDPVVLRRASEAVRSKRTFPAFLLGEAEVSESVPTGQLGTLTVVGGAEIVRAFERKKNSGN